MGMDTRTCRTGTGVSVSSLTPEARGARPFGPPLTYPRARLGPTGEEEEEAPRANTSPLTPALRVSAHSPQPPSLCVRVGCMCFSLSELSVQCTSLSVSVSEMCVVS